MIVPDARWEITSSFASLSEDKGPISWVDACWCNDVWIRVLYRTAGPLCPSELHMVWLYPLGFFISSCDCVGGPSESRVVRMPLRDFFLCPCWLCLSMTTPTFGSDSFLYCCAKQQTCRGIIRCLGKSKSCFVTFAQWIQPFMKQMWPDGPFHRDLICKEPVIYSINYITHKSRSFEAGDIIFSFHYPQIPLKGQNHQHFLCWQNLIEAYSSRLKTQKWAAVLHLVICRVKWLG